MKMTRSIAIVAGVAIVSAMVVMFSACEKDGNTETVDDMFNDTYVSADRDTKPTLEYISLSPSSASVTKIGEQVAFTVRGGKKPYRWSVSDTAVGTISPSTTPTDVAQSVYKALKLTKNTVVVTDSQGRAAVVDVTGTPSAMSLTPASWTFISAYTNGAALALTDIQGETVKFVVSGGVPPYSWNAAAVSLGAVDGSGLYTVANPLLATGVNNITVVDSDGTVVSGTVKVDYHP